jgi:hypothetical protein
MSSGASPDTVVPGPAAASHAYRERLWPGPLGWALVPASAVLAAIALWPLHPVASAVGAGVVLVAALVAAWRVAVVVEVAGGELRVGAARIPVAALGAPVPLDRAGMRQALGPGSDARAWVCLRAWVPGGVQVPVTDPGDPTPEWIVSTRRPQALASAVERAQAHSEQTIRPSFS